MLPMEKSEAEHLGELTYTDLSDTGAFCLPPEQDAWGIMRMPFSYSLARMSAELAADGYELDIKPWQNAGWEDCTFIVEDKIVALDTEEDSRLATIEGEWKRRRARAMISGVNPFNDLLRAVRQLMVTDLGKSIIMTKTAADGKRVVAISFIGTTQKYFDWFANFKFHSHEGMHYGFVELARQFEAMSARILLPKLAAALGEETFTLADVMLEARKPESRVHLWISGHSQGGALAQTYTYLLMCQGVRMDMISAYTFAAPTVAVCDGQVDPGRYPIYNIINTDDIVPRIGAQIRLGMDWVFTPRDSFRKAYYGVEEEQWPAFSRVMHATSQIQSTNDGVVWLIALCRRLGEMDGEDAAQAFLKDALPHLSLLKKMNLSMDEVFGFFEGKLVAQYKQLTGDVPDEALCSHYYDTLLALTRDLPPGQMPKLLMHGLGGPHRIRPDKHDESFVPPYVAIVRKYLDLCQRGIWMGDTPARCLSVDGEQLLPRRRGILFVTGEAPARLADTAQGALGTGKEEAPGPSAERS